MNSIKNKKKFKRETRKTVFGIKLPPIETVNNCKVKTILDVDTNYYSLVEGRPIKPNTSLNTYKQNIKEVAMKRSVHGFLVDEILRIEREIETERNIYETASRHFEEYQDSFDKFLADDNNKTIAIMKKSDALAKDLSNKTEEHKKVNYEMASLKSKLQYIDETLLILLSFENFLHKAAPILWQESNNIIFDKKHSEIISLDSDIFRHIDIKIIRQRLNKLSPPRIYFKTPDQLLKVFSTLENQNLNYLLVTEELNAEKNNFLKALNILRSLLRGELDHIHQKISEIEDTIKFNEIREIELKEVFYKILDDKIRYLVSSDTVLQIFNYAEFVYEHIIAQNDTKQSSIEMVLALEREYDNITLSLSTFDLNLLKNIEKETYENGTKEIKRANEACKLLKNVDKLSRRLKSSYEPTRRKVCN